MKRKQVTRVKEYRSVTHKFKCASLAPNKQLLATGDDNHTLNIWSFQANAPLLQYGGFTSEVTSCDFSQNEEIVYAGSQAGTMIAWDVSAQKVVATFKEHMNEIKCVSTQKLIGSNMVATGSVDTNVKLWDLRQKKSVFTLKQHSKPITCISIDEDNKYIASGASDSYLQIWDMSQGRNIFHLRDGGKDSAQNGVTAVIPGPNQSLISGHMDRKLRIWDLNQGKLVSTCAPDTQPAQKLIFSPDKSLFFAGLADSIKVFPYSNPIQQSPSEIVMKAHSTILAMASGNRVDIVELLPSQKSVVLSQIEIHELNQPDYETREPYQQQTTADSFFNKRNDRQTNSQQNKSPITLKKMRANPKQYGVNVDDSTSSLDFYGLNSAQKNKQQSPRQQIRTGSQIRTGMTIQGTSRLWPGKQSSQSVAVKDQEQFKSTFGGENGRIKTGGSRQSKEIEQARKTAETLFPDIEQITQKIAQLQHNKPTEEQKQQKKQNRLAQSGMEVVKNRIPPTPVPKSKFNGAEPVFKMAPHQQPVDESLEILIKETGGMAKMNKTGMSDVSSLYQMPMNKPVGLDFNKLADESFLPNGANDLQLIQKALKQSNIVGQVLFRRQKNLKQVQRWWSNGDMNSCVNTLTQLNDPSVTNDFLKQTFGATIQRTDNYTLLTLENGPAILGHALTLINSKFPDYNETGIRTYRTVFLAFQDRLTQMKTIPVSGKVDIERDGRLIKCDKLIDQLENILAAPGFDKALKSQNIQLRELAGHLDNDIDFFVTKLRSQQKP